MKCIFSFLFLLILSLGSSRARNADIPVNKSSGAGGPNYYKNPLFEPDLADPSFIKAADGWFYAYGTENTWSPGVHRITPIVRSKNLVDWEFVGDAFQMKPAWKSSGYIWAPQIIYHSGNAMYYLYYSFSAWGDPNPGIGLARSKYPYGPFEDLGKVLDTQSSGVKNSIDPFYISTGKGRHQKHYLFWGSFEGIWGVEMTNMKTPQLSEKFKIAGNAFEASYIYEYDGKYYLFLSSSSCCEGANTKYRISVAAADNIKGPYKTKDGRSILPDKVEGTPFLWGNKQKGWIGPGHNGEIIRDDNNRYFMLYHAVDLRNPLLPNGATRRPLMMDELIWKDGWPSIAEGNPSNTLRIAPYFKPVSTKLARTEYVSLKILIRGKELKFFDDSKEPKCCKVFDITGKLTRIVDFTDQTAIDLPSGIYIIDIIKNNAISFKTKVLIP